MYEQVELYIRSNPNYAKGGAGAASEPKISDDDLLSHVEGALSLIGQVLTLNSLQKQDSSYVESSAEQTASIGHLAQAFEKMVEDSADGVGSFKDAKVRQDFVSAFGSLAAGKDDNVCPDGVSFAALRSFV